MISEERRVAYHTVEIYSIASGTSQSVPSLASEPTNFILIINLYWSVTPLVSINYESTVNKLYSQYEQLQRAKYHTCIDKYQYESVLRHFISCGYLQDTLKAIITEEARKITSGKRK